MTEIIKIDPIAAGNKLSQAIASLREIATIEEAHGELIAGLARIQCQLALKQTMEDEQVRALVLAGANLAYEVCESDNFKLSDEDKITGVVMALSKGYRLQDPRGHHFAVLKGKGNVTMMPKEQGYRHQLERLGATNIDCQATAFCMEPRANNAKKLDMIVIGHASCSINGLTSLVERTRQLPMRLPCYESDGPDGHEAKGRRRLLRDLWQKVSGIHEVADGDEMIVNVVETVDTASITNQPAEIDWAAEFKRYGVIEQAQLLRDAKTSDDRNEVLAVAKEQLSAKMIDQRGYEMLERYAATKES